MMTKKHFIAMAEALKKHKASEELVVAMAQICARDNPNFRVVQFMEAAKH